MVRTFTWGWEDLNEALDVLLKGFDTEVKKSYDVKSDEATSTIELELPGVSKNKVHVRAQDKGSYQEVKVFGTGRDGKEFEKVYNFYDHDINDISAVHKDGLLKVVVPKTIAKARDIHIN